MSTVNDPLKYLWLAEFDDGHTISQPPDDKYPGFDPEADHNPSAFRLISDYLPNSPLKSFCVFNPMDGVSIAKVYLKTGMFKVRGSKHSFRLCSLDEPRNPDLIFYRIVRQDRVITPVIENGVLVDSKTEDKAPEIKGYALGWKDHGKSNEHVLVLE